MSITIFPHTTNENVADYNLIPVGTLLLGFLTKNITTKTYKNSITIVGNSKRNLKDFIQYSSFSDGSILRYYKGQLTTVVPNIYIKDISGVQISGSAPYLAVTSFGTIVNADRKEYQVKELSDVVDAVAANKYALTYNGEVWGYAPESSALGRFDDVSYAVVSYGVFVSYFLDTSFGGFGNSYRILPFTISWDKAPVLGGNLNCNSKVLNNLTYLCQNLEAQQPLSSLVVDTIQHSEANIVCANEVKVLDLQFLVNSNHLKFFTLNLLNFVGIISFRADAEISFENGYLPKITKSDNTYSLLIYKDDVKLKIIVLYKNRNMTAFTNGN
jgi:hypothetical protein